MKLDEKDRIIITMYADDPNISQEKIAARIKMSQPSVAIAGGLAAKEWRPGEADGGQPSEDGVLSFQGGRYHYEA